MSTGREILRRSEAGRAIYVDFEGNKDMAPTLLGVLVEGDVEQWIVEAAFRDCAVRRGAPARVAELRGLALALLDRAEAEDRLILSWSEHDYHLLAGVLDCPHDGRRLDTVYRNAIPTARRWRNTCRPGQLIVGNALETYAEQIAWKKPAQIGPGTVGPALSRIRARLDTDGGCWSRLTDGQRQAWRGVLRHNWHDLTQMSRITRFCARKLDRRAERRSTHRRRNRSRRTAAVGRVAI